MTSTSSSSQSLPSPVRDATLPPPPSSKGYPRLSAGVTNVSQATTSSRFSRLFPFWKRLVQESVSYGRKLPLSSTTAPLSWVTLRRSTCRTSRQRRLSTTTRLSWLTGMATWLSTTESLSCITQTRLGLSRVETAFSMARYLGSGTLPWVSVLISSKPWLRQLRLRLNLIR